jgi:hypothetical protein
MAETKLLDQIKKLFEDEREQTRKLVCEEVGAIEKRLSDKIDTVDLKVEAVNKKVGAVDLKVEAVHEFNKKAHTEIMVKLAERNEIIGMELKTLKPVSSS